VLTTDLLLPNFTTADLQSRIYWRSQSELYRDMV